jgi:hypothetical protein
MSAEAGAALAGSPRTISDTEMKPSATSSSNPEALGTLAALDDQRSSSLLARLRGRGIRLLPHEYVFTLFLALTCGRLAVHVGFFNPLTLTFLGFVLASASVILWSGPEPRPWRWRVRLLLYPVLMGLTFYLMRPVVTALEVPRADALLVNWDMVWLHSNINLAIQGWEPPLFTDLMMLAYVFFFYYLVAGPGYYCIHDLARFKQCFSGLFVVYALGFLGYTTLPAGGPHRFLEFARPLTGGRLTRLAKPFLDYASNGVDAFPSIHVAVSLYLLAFDRMYYRRRFWRVLAPCVALWISTIYLRYHYGVDVIAGMAFATVGLWAANRYGRTCLDPHGSSQIMDAVETAPALIQPAMLSRMAQENGNANEIRA